ncbi:hypothetical protein LEP1GSC082_1052 [Leptospira kirschneri str. H2]|nr:hypothetical protein LEP1GSC082_1052 [Leptospira kirschneri str. H2]
MSLVSFHFLKNLNFSGTTIYCILHNRNEVLILDRIWNIADAGKIKSILSESLEISKIS